MPPTQKRGKHREHVAVETASISTQQDNKRRIERIILTSAILVICLILTTEFRLLPRRSTLSLMVGGLLPLVSSLDFVLVFFYVAGVIRSGRRVDWRFGVIVLSGCMAATPAVVLVYRLIS